MPFFTRSAAVPELKSATGFKPHLRRDFRYQCAYCGITEVYRRAVDSFGVDHFRPKSLFPDLEHHYPNLYYCCNQCNSYKGGTWPDAVEAEAGYAFADPCQYDPYERDLAQSNDARLIAQTPIGEYTLDNIRLNREELLRFRRRLAQILGRIALCRQLLGDSGWPAEEIRRSEMEAILNDLETEWKASLVGVPWEDA